MSALHFFCCSLCRLQLSQGQQAIIQLFLQGFLLSLLLFSRQVGILLNRKGGNHVVRLGVFHCK